MEQMQYTKLKKNIEDDCVDKKDTEAITVNIWNSRAAFTKVFTTGSFLRLAFRAMVPCCRWKKNNSRGIVKQELLYNNGQKRFYNELDVVNLL